MKEQYKTLFAYHWYTTGRLMAGAAALSEEAYHAHPGFGHGSVHDILVHVLRAMQGWRVALDTGRQTRTSRAEDFPTLSALEAAFATEKAAWESLVEGYDSENLAGNVSLTNWRGDTYTIPLWRVLQHLILHGMQHHAEIAGLLTARGQSPGDLDFIFYNG